MNRQDANATSWAVRALSVWYLTRRYGKLPAIGAAVVTAVLWTNTDSAHISSSSGLRCRAARARDNAVSLYMGTEADQEVPCRSEGVIILGDLVFGQNKWPLMPRHHLYTRLKAERNRWV